LSVKFETKEKDAAGCTNTDALTLARDIVAFPLTSFRPESRNIISNESIKVYDWTTNVAAKFNGKKYLNSPGITVTLKVKAFETVGENESAT
jgi:hypothetical protein